MEPEELHELAGDPRFISGIYNYCDRWCERCPFSSRCLLYAMEERETARDPAANDLNNAAFWQRLHGSFGLVHKMIAQMAEEQGVDLTQLSTEKVARQRRQRKPDPKKRGLAQLAMKYIKMVDRWFKTEQPLFEEKAETLTSLLQAGIAGQDPVADAQDIAGAGEVIRWYQHQIYVKLRRAMSGSKKEEAWLEKEGFPSDADGSTKVALIGIDRSLAAWGRLRGHFPDRADALLDILVHLDRLRRGVEAEFPKARAFKRPGFDDEPATNE